MPSLTILICTHNRRALLAKALASLQAAWNLRDGGIMLMYADPLLATLHGTDGYLALAKSVGFA